MKDNDKSGALDVQEFIGRYDDTLRTLKQVLADDSDNERVHYYFATTYLRKGDLKQAPQLLSSIGKKHLSG